LGASFQILGPVRLSYIHFFRKEMSLSIMKFLFGIILFSQLNGKFQKLKQEENTLQNSFIKEMVYLLQKGNLKLELFKTHV
jgi:hypothetical protein